MAATLLFHSVTSMALSQAQNAPVTTQQVLRVKRISVNQSQSGAWKKGNIQ